jgi:hypothetical protein
VFRCFFAPLIIKLLLFFSLLLFVVFNVYYESSQHVKPPDPIVVTPALPQIEVFGSVLPQNGVFKIALSQNEVLKIQNKDILAQITAPFNEMENHIEQFLLCHSQPQFHATEKLR